MHNTYLPLLCVFWNRVTQAGLELAAVHKVTVLVSDSSVFLEGLTPRLVSSLASFCLASSSGIKGLKHRAFLPFVDTFLPGAGNSCVYLPLLLPLHFFPVLGKNPGGHCTLGNHFNIELHPCPQGNIFSKVFLSSLIKKGPPGKLPSALTS